MLNLVNAREIDRLRRELDHLNNDDLSGHFERLKFPSSTGSRLSKTPIVANYHEYQSCINNTVVFENPKVMRVGKLYFVPQEEWTVDDRSANELLYVHDTPLRADMSLTNMLQIETYATNLSHDRERILPILDDLKTRSYEERQDLFEVADYCLSSIRDHLRLEALVIGLSPRDNDPLNLQLNELNVP